MSRETIKEQVFRLMAAECEASDVIASAWLMNGIAGLIVSKAIDAIEQRLIAIERRNGNVSPAFIKVLAQLENVESVASRIIADGADADTILLARAVIAALDDAERCNG